MTQTEKMNVRSKGDRVKKSKGKNKSEKKNHSRFSVFGISDFQTAKAFMDTQSYDAILWARSMLQCGNVVCTASQGSERGEKDTRSLQTESSEHGSSSEDDFHILQHDTPEKQKVGPTLMGLEENSNHSSDPTTHAFQSTAGTSVLFSMDAPSIQSNQSKPTSDYFTLSLSCDSNDHSMAETSTSTLNWSWATSSNDNEIIEENELQLLAVALDDGNDPISIGAVSRYNKAKLSHRSNQERNEHVESRSDHAKKVVFGVTAGKFVPVQKFVGAGNRREV